MRLTLEDIVPACQLAGSSALRKGFSPYLEGHCPARCMRISWVKTLDITDVAVLGGKPKFFEIDAVA